MPTPSSEIEHWKSLLSSLPRKEFYLSDDLAKYFQVTKANIQRHAKLRSIGKLKKRSQGGRGVYVFKRVVNNPETCDIVRLYKAMRKGVG